jgi:hypothetical protein
MLRYIQIVYLHVEKNFIHILQTLKKTHVVELILISLWY